MVDTKDLFKQGSSYEDDYLVRSIGSIGKIPDVALTELVANAWDAGATKVKITIPMRNEDSLIVEDDGSGMTHEQFLARWMTLGYNRIKHQGIDVEFPEIRSNWQRKAYGRNGIGRHSMLCFADNYEVTTWKNGEASSFTISVTSGKEPFVVIKENNFKKEGHGTQLKVNINRNLPKPDAMRNILAARFLHDPNFNVLVNEVSVDLLELPGLISQDKILVGDITLIATAVDTTKTARTMQRQGAAFWVNGRLVGEPSWILRRKSIIDGRTQFGKKFTFIFKTNDLSENVLPDWSGFSESESMNEVYEAVSKYISDTQKKFLDKSIQETKRLILCSNRNEIKQLSDLAKLEVVEFLNDITNVSPLLTEEDIAPSFKAILKLEKSRSGKALLNKLINLTDGDIEALNSLLDSWSIKDALTVLEEVDRRISIIEAIKHFSSDSSINELKTLHPLVTQARWLFGPEFESTEYTSNITIINVIKKLIGLDVTSHDFINHLKRPDLVILSDSTLSATAIEGFNHEDDLISVKDILLIELKKGGATIGRKEMNQAVEYVEDILHSGIEGNPSIKAYVVGHKLDKMLTPVQTLGENGSSKIIACTYERLINTASKRMFKLRERLNERYDQPLKDSILEKILNQPEQLTL